MMEGTDMHADESIDNFPAICTFMPHSGRMVLLNRVLSADAENLCAEVVIRPDSLFCESDHGVGNWIGVEYMAQAIAAYAGYNASLRDEPVKVGFLLGTRSYDAHCSYFAVGSVLHVAVQRLIQTDNGVGSFECSITDTDRKTLATATITVFQPDDADAFLQSSEK
ncbi:hotdog family protein [Glaciimonas soli]|nr:hotdog family protein [Glaciimonas soli]